MWGMAGSGKRQGIRMAGNKVNQRNLGEYKRKGKLWQQVIGVDDSKDISIPNNESKLTPHSPQS